MTPASSPCIRVCLLDRETGLCEGCGRNAGEIARWGRMSEGERLALMAILPDRLERAYAASPAVPATPRPGGPER